MTRTVLSLQGLGKHFGLHRAVAGVSLDIHENEFFALLGASGSGKTTLLRMIAGFESPSAGTILLDGEDITRLQPNRRPLNLMFQSYALFPHMTVARNIAYGLEMERLPRAEVAARVDEILSRVQLSHLAQRKPEQLSGGQRQRVALARALVKRPKVLLLDEPLGALDKKLRTEMQLELKRIQNEFGITFIVVTHDQEEAMVMADRIAILHNGALLQCGAPHEIYEYPASRFAAEFIGVMNFLEVRHEAGTLVAQDGSRIRVERVAEGLAQGVPLVVAVRPERLRIGAGDADNIVNGRIAAMAYHGQDLQLHVNVDIAAKPMVVRVTAEDADRKRFGPGDSVVLGWSARDTRIYPA